MVSLLLLFCLLLVREATLLVLIKNEAVKAEDINYG